MGSATDKAIWGLAQQHDYAIVTLDADFHEYSLLWPGPPLIVWMKCGNQPKKVILEKLLTNKDVIEYAHRDPNIWCVEIY
jgi:predicted nuclease of predicted toxin-antitoxin system